MHQFLNIIVSFPTVVFTILLAFSLLYWMVVLLGLIDTEVLDSLFFDADGVDAGALAGLLTRLGLNGVPVTVIISLIVLFAWLSSYFATLLLWPLLSNQVAHLLLGAGIFIAALLAAVVLTAIALRPVRALLKKIPQETPKVVLGRIGVVRSATVSATQGYALVEDGGAGLVLQIRTVDETLPRGTRVVLIEHIAANNTWRVVSEEEFTGAV
ncbi:ubiquinone biosynthesis protein UbiH [Lampropedia puyangensis]|uniref:Ubiquinone biosynthesis protein UbiH n=1 Tax=Lampropedia puyangensis TaxID=1330072 RepID=A0A4S8F848_9BURK|nr:ubiquinone biosynthesis protein UbiH [Lampropedia puyangensis]THU03680.1 ubiquinone biosynthesis protein UbiH [Lampropedia puyangensis]